MPDKMSEQEAEQLASEIMADLELEDARTYLMRARVYAALPLDALRNAWVEKFRARDMQAMNDLAAELRLRREQPPFDRVDDEAGHLLEKINCGGPQSKAFARAIETFLRGRKQAH